MRVANLKELRRAVQHAGGPRVLQGDVAKRANMSAADLCRFEGGRKAETFRQAPILAAYCELCGVDLTWEQIEDLQAGMVLEVELRDVSVAKAS